ncbi:response regulator [Fundidesulfovibrio soli]|uniref:response regulator n=1 Tax=Fundidesulfovibrio soli TaxID=2922716 RepID=UPI001FB021D4
MLVAEDTPVMRELICGLLEPLELGRLLQAASGQDAWELLESGGVDVVVADWLMPGMNGLELLDRMRGDDRFAAVPFIMVTGVPDKRVLGQCGAYPATDCILKPVDGSELKRKLLKALGRPRS